MPTPVRRAHEFAAAPEGPEHAAYLLGVLGDGSRAQPVERPVDEYDPDPEAGPTVLVDNFQHYDGQDGRPQCVAVRVGCTCGWEGTQMYPLPPRLTEEVISTRWDEIFGGPWEEWRAVHIEETRQFDVPRELKDAIGELVGQVAKLATRRPLAAVAAADLMQRESRSLLRGAVEHYDPASVSGGWAKLGTALGVSRQAAWQRFSGEKNAPPLPEERGGSWPVPQPPEVQAAVEEAAAGGPVGSEHAE